MICPVRPITYIGVDHAVSLVCKQITLCRGLNTTWIAHDHK
jgi:hypothetical protein